MLHLVFVELTVFRVMSWNGKSNGCWCLLWKIFCVPLWSLMPWIDQGPVLGSFGGLQLQGFLSCCQFGSCSRFLGSLLIGLVCIPSVTVRQSTAVNYSLPPCKWKGAASPSSASFSVKEHCRIMRSAAPHLMSLCGLIQFLDFLGYKAT